MLFCLGTFMYLFAPCSENYCVWNSDVIFTALPEASKDIKLVTQMQRMLSLASKPWELNPAFSNQGEVHFSEWKLWPPQGLLRERNKAWQRKTQVIYFNSSINDLVSSWVVLNSTKGNWVLMEHQSVFSLKLLWNRALVNGSDE